MCGIFGAVKTRGSFEPADFHRFVELTDLVQYRGPDDKGYVIFEVANGPVREGARFDVFLGHRRLAILDLSSAGHQPMCDGQGHWIVFNGEVFNYLELQKDLKKKGHQFRTATDTEVILHVYQEYGESGFDLLNGMWAFVLLDLPRRRVVLSRDRFSIKPLYVYRDDSRFYFGSEIKQLLPLLPLREPNLGVVGAYLDQMLLDHSQETFFRRIVRLMPRTNAVISLDSGRYTETRYWDFPKSQSISEWPQAVENFRELLQDSVRIRLRSDVKVGVLLSGGLDSSAITVLAQKVVGEGLETYSIVSDSACSEERFVDVVNSVARSKNLKLVARIQQLAPMLDRVLYHSDEPFGGFGPVAQLQMMEVIRRDTDTTVVLSGQGGDEVLLGYLKFWFFYVRGLIQTHKYLHAAAELLASFINRTVAWQFRLEEARRYIRVQGESRRQFIITNTAPVPIWEAVDIRTRQALELERYSVPALMHYEDRNSMAHSLETRHPFLDHRLVEFLLTLPTDLKLRRGWTKYILRHSLHELPPAIRWRRDKQGATLPDRPWLRDDLTSLIRRLFRESALSEIGAINEAEFLSFYDRFRRGAIGVWQNEISRVLIAELWARKFIRMESATSFPGGTPDSSLPLRTTGVPSCR